MNVTELARILKITPNELREKLPQLGFSIGPKAIKINNNLAHKIIKEWPQLIKQFEAKENLKLKDEKVIDKEEKDKKKKIKIPNPITVREFSYLAGLSVNRILAELMKNGIFVSLNERIDFETAWLVADNLGLEVALDKTREEKADKENKLEEILASENQDKLKLRPPVIVVMGHVDHGKTKLLDTIRQANVVEGEAGGITQHIGAYQVNRKNKLITFIDTPGHEAFTAMRSRGARIADIAILVVAADDGVKPQTIEAYRIIESAKIPLLVAINKIDKPEANIDKTKQELSTQLQITPEDWGGKIICLPISAKEGTGIEELLDMILLIADMESDNIKANPEAEAIGTVIESHIDKGSGPLATILIQNGTLHIGDQLVANKKIYGKVRALKDYRGLTISQADPAMPVEVIGLKILPGVGDILQVGEGERIKVKKIKIGPPRPKESQASSSEEDDDSIKKINLIIKSDVFGSAEAIEESLEKITADDVKINIIHKGLGNITDGDIKRAEAVQGQIIGFNVKVPPAINELVREKNINIKLYNIIYDLINDIKKQAQELIEPGIRRLDLGKLRTLEVFRTETNKQIIGGKVTEGKIEIGCFIEVVRNKQIIEKGKLMSLQSGKQEVTIVEEGQECGIQYEGEPVIQVGDILQCYKEEKITKQL